MRYKLSGFALLTVFLVGLASAWSNPANANPALLFELDSGKVLSHEDAFKRWYPASLTKLMTVYVAFRAVDAGELRLDSPIHVSKNSAGEPPSKMGYKPGSVMTLDNALRRLVVKSANDIATATAETVCGSEQAFVARLNAEAKRLGMTGTHYVNAHGLFSVAQYSTARDLALLVRAIRTEYPQYAGYFSIEAIDTGEHIIPSYNILLGRFTGADGMKTGFVCASGFNLIGSATRSGRTLVAVVLGTTSQLERAEKAAELLSSGFKMPSLAAPTIYSLKPYGTGLDVPTDMRPIVCSEQAQSERWGERDEEGNLVIRSKLLHEMDREPRAVAVGLGGVTGPETTQPRYADVPIPTPRPDYPPRGGTIAVSEGG